MKIVITPILIGCASKVFFYGDADKEPSEKYFSHIIINTKCEIGYFGKITCFGSPKDNGSVLLIEDENVTPISNRGRESDSTTLQPREKKGLASLGDWWRKNCNILPSFKSCQCKG